MWAWVAFVLIALIFTVAAAWVSRRLLDGQVGWIRASLTALIVFLACLPLATWAMRETDVLDLDDDVTVSGPIALAFLALVAGWIFAIVVVVIVTLEFLWPSHRVRNPVSAIRDAFRRRDRARRYAQILAIASRHGLGAFQNRHGGDDELASALIAALNEAGVTFVKLGQVLSSREDVLPRDLVDALSTLQMDSTPIPWAEAEAAITAELGRPIDEVFASIDPQPLAAASVAQVHTARLRGDGEEPGDEVVVKIQRPRARAQVTTDLDILERLARTAEARTDWARDYGAVALAAEFSRALSDELDYRVEAANTEMLRGAIARSSSMTLAVPILYEPWCTSRMIVQQRITGTPFSRIATGSLDPDEARRLADGVLESVFEQIAVRGVFHADLHPGNLILQDDGTVALIDFGAVGVSERSLRRMLIPLLLALSADDDVAATNVILLMCAPETGAVDHVALQHDIGVILTRMQNAQVDENIFRALVDVLRRHRLSIPPSLLLVLRTLSSLEGTLRRLVPDYDMVGHALERAPHFARATFDPKNAALGAQAHLMLAGEELRRLPRRLENVTRSLEDGTFSVRLRSLEGSGERGWLEEQLNRFLVTVVGVALLAVGISLTVSGDGPMLTGNVGAFPFLGSLVGLGGLLLLVRSLRRALRRRDGG